jgi:signal transduction histidine kinase
LISASDTGIVISPENIGRIFDPFFTTKSVDKGSGLGLSAAAGIIEEHVGKIEVESPHLLQEHEGEDTKGTVFIIHLPVLRDKKAKEET